MGKSRQRKKRSSAQNKQSLISSVQPCPHCYVVYSIRLPRIEDFQITSYRGSSRISEFHLDVSNCWQFRNYRGELYFRTNVSPRCWYYRHPNSSALLCEPAALCLDQTYGRFVLPFLDYTYNWLCRGYIRLYINGRCMVIFSPYEYHKQTIDKSREMTNNSHHDMSLPFGFYTSSQVPELNTRDVVSSQHERANQPHVQKNSISGNQSNVSLPFGFYASRQVPDFYTRDMASSQHERANQPPVHKNSISGSRSNTGPLLPNPFSKADVQDSSSNLPLVINPLQQSRAVANATTREKPTNPANVDEHLKGETRKEPQMSVNASHKAYIRYQVHENSLRQNRAVANAATSEMSIRPVNVDEHLKGETRKRPEMSVNFSHKANIRYQVHENSLQQNRAVANAARSEMSSKPVNIDEHLKGETRKEPQMSVNASHKASIRYQVHENSLQQNRAVANAATSEKSSKPVNNDEHLKGETRKERQISVNVSHKASTRYRVNETPRLIETESSCISQKPVTVKREQDDPCGSTSTKKRTQENVTKSTKGSTTLAEKHKTVIKTEVIEEVSKFHGSRSSKVTAGPCLKDRGLEDVSQSKTSSTSSSEIHKSRPKKPRLSENGAQFLGQGPGKNTKVNSKTADNTSASKELVPLVHKSTSVKINIRENFAALIGKKFSLPQKTETRHLNDADNTGYDGSKAQPLHHKSKSVRKEKVKPNRELNISHVAPKSKPEVIEIRNSNALDNTELSASGNRKRKRNNDLPSSPKTTPHNKEKHSAIGEAVKIDRECQGTLTSANRTLDFQGTSQPSSSTKHDTNVLKAPSEAQQPIAKNMNSITFLCGVPDHQLEDPFEYVCVTCKLKHQFKLPSSDDLAAADTKNSPHLNRYNSSNKTRLWFFQNLRGETLIRTLHGPPTWYFKPPFCMQQELCVHYGSVLEDFYARFIQAFSNSQTMERESLFTTEGKPGTQFSDLLRDVQRQMKLGSVSGIGLPSLTCKNADVQVEVHLVNEDERRVTSECKPKEDQVERNRFKEDENPGKISNNTLSDQYSNDVSVSRAGVNPSHGNSCFITSGKERLNLHSVLSSVRFLSFNPVEKTFYCSRRNL